jgi:gamma-glutamyltranspeptidase/glutathione hydrolase
VSGVVAAGHPLTAETGAQVLRAGGNAVDAALAAMGAAFTCEPLLTGLGAGGYMLVAEPGADPVLLDFFVAAPGSGGAELRSELIPVDVSFGDAVQVFHVGAASVGAYGVPAGMAHAAERWGTIPLAELLAPGAALAREGVAINETQAYIVEILQGVLVHDEDCAARWAPGDTVKTAGDRWGETDVAEALERLGADGAAPFYTGDIAAAAVDYVAERGGTLTREDLEAYAPVEREPVRVRFRGRNVLTNPPPSAGGLLIAYVLALLDRDEPPSDTLAIVEAMERAQAERTPDFLAGLARPGFTVNFAASRLGSTTHLSVIDAEGRACAVTCSNGVGSGLIVPGTGLHLNNMMGEQDLNPLGFHQFPPGRRMPSMMSPTIVQRDDEVELALGSAGSNRIRSAIVQTLLGVVERGLPVQEAVEAARMHFEDGTVYVEPGVDVTALEASGRTVQAFRAPNVFFGGVQAVERDPATGALTGGGDPRRGGSVAIA